MKVHKKCPAQKRRAEVEVEIMAKTKLSENVRKVIAEKGLKHKAVAERIGRTEQQFSAMLNGRRIVRDCDVVAIADALGVTPNDLLCK